MNLDGRVGEAVLTDIFLARYREGSTTINFSIDEFDGICNKLGLPHLSNKADLVYGYRFRLAMPGSITTTQPAGYEWTIELAGKGKYRFALRTSKWFVPSELPIIKLPEQTPTLMKQFVGGDEQAQLSTLRVNRVVDMFLGMVTHSLQNHLRATVKLLNNSQIEIDELYYGVDKHGLHYVVPVEAKSGKDFVAAVQAIQDIGFCKQEYPAAICRPVGIYFWTDGSFTMFELSEDENGEILIVQEKRYLLVPATHISRSDLDLYSQVASPIDRARQASVSFLFD
jgi:hypothetical protein